MYKVTVSGKGQISLPAELRKRYDLKKGDKLIIKETENNITLCPVGDHPVLQLRGKLKDDESKSLVEQLLEDRKKERVNDK